LSLADLGDSIGRAEPLVRAERPRPALFSKNRTPANNEEPARGPAADEGVRPTIDADRRNWENQVALGFSPAFVEEHGVSYMRVKSPEVRSLLGGATKEIQATDRSFSPERRRDALRSEAEAES
jgi:hypothetical protein